MAIQFFTDKIKIGDFTLYEGNGGLQFDGVARAENFKGGAGTFQGTVAGYRGGGYGPGSIANIAKFSFTTNTPSTSVGNLTQTRTNASGASSKLHGYALGGTPPVSNTIDKFPFSTDTNATDVGDLATALRFGLNGQSSPTYGYAAGGRSAPGATVAEIHKVPFAADTNGTIVGNLNDTAKHEGAGQSSSTSGYVSGGSNGPLGTATNTIDKFPFATDTNASDVGDLTVIRGQRPAGVSSKTHGYTAGGYTGPPIVPGNTRYNTIDKFPFSSDANATDVGDLTNTMFSLPGFSSVENGYTGAGDAGPSSVNTINRWPFATDTNAVDTGADMLGANSNGAGTQV